jgi:hypothetical protein
MVDFTKKHKRIYLFNIVLACIFTIFIILYFLGMSSISYAAWTGPTSAPPNGNVETPINTGATSQTKTGVLSALGGFFTSATVRADKGFCIGSSCITSWSAAGGSSDTLDNVADRGNRTNQSIYTPRVYDYNNGSFYIDPASTSILNDVRASILRDRNNTSYYVDPASTSKMNRVDANIIYDRQNTGYYLNPASVSNLNDVRASILRDRNNTSYYVDPASTSNLNSVYGNNFYIRAIGRWVTDLRLSRQFGAIYTTTSKLCSGNDIMVGFYENIPYCPDADSWCPSVTMVKYCRRTLY